MEARVRNVVPFVSALVALGSARGAGQTVTYSFNAHTISLTLPPDYLFQGEASPTPGVKTIAFTTEPRSDGSRGLIQVSLVDLRQLGDAQRPSLEHFTRSVVDGVRQRRSQWKEAETLVEVGGVRARRVEWSGSNEPSPERPPSQAPSMMRGVMIVGITGDLAFALHTQDVEPFAAATVPKSEQALMTFASTRQK